ncbi:MAG: hypothetical protein DWQ36_01870 [Acidobacteria bacterium]|nr:MAG: hypothetical protein DWQ30_16715 [Acidobacteriota bacterium]REK11517.1 MAG: hypothetical protein DWQ36_01870 [Acidobacteriota bacterium]
MQTRAVPQIHQVGSQEGHGCTSGVPVAARASKGSPAILVLVALIAAPLVGPATLAASRSAEKERAEPDAFAEYEQLRALHGTPPFGVGEDHLVFDFEGARFELEAGEISLQQPLRSGAVTGFWFEGDGRFVLDVPDEYELSQLRRFTRDEELTGLEVSFDRLFVQVAAPELVRPLTALAAERELLDGPWGAPPYWVRGRQTAWLLEQHHDPASRVLAALSTFGERYLRAVLRIEEHGWVTFSFDARRREEIELLHHTRANLALAPNFGESWLSLDQASDRDEDGRAAPEPGGFSALEHLDAEIELLELGENPASGFGANHPIDARIDVAARLRSLRDGLGAVVLQLDPRSRIERVRSASGRTLPVLRFPRGELANHLDDEWGNREFVVLLEEPLRAGEQVTLQLEYLLELSNFAPGLSWHPNSTDYELRPFTASMLFRLRDRYDVLASGQEVDSGRDERGEWSRWEMQRPSRIVGFTFARYAHTARFEWDGVPPLTLFGTTGGYLSVQRIEDLSRFFEGNLRCLVDLLGPPDAEEMVVTLINAGHSQSFEGFLQVSENIAKKGRLGVAVHGTKELLAAHELAHQWWGHKVKPDSYRDAWLAEALAEYSAALCVRDSVDDGERVFADIVDAFRNEVHGSTAGAFNAFARPGLSVRNRFERDRMPPISHGYRAAVRHNPFAVVSTVYRKGALVLHMIDQLLRIETGSRDAFLALLRRLSDRGVATRLRTDDLMHELEAVSELDWRLLFEQWVHRAEVPTWRSQVTIGPQARSALLRIEQRDAAPEFTSWAPVRATLRDGGFEERLIQVRGLETEIEVRFEGVVDTVEIDPGFAIPVRQRGGRSARAGELHRSHRAAGG